MAVPDIARTHLIAVAMAIVVAIVVEVLVNILSEIIYGVKL